MPLFRTVSGAISSELPLPFSFTFTFIITVSRAVACCETQKTGYKLEMLYCYILALKIDTFVMVCLSFCYIMAFSHVDTVSLCGS